MFLTLRHVWEGKCVKPEVLFHLIKFIAFVKSFYASVDERPFEKTHLPHYLYTTPFYMLERLLG